MLSRTNFRKRQETARRRREEGNRLSDLLAKGLVDRRTDVFLKGTSYRVFRFGDGSLGIRRGTHWVLYKNGSTSEILKRARSVFARQDVEEVMKS